MPEWLTNFLWIFFFLYHSAVILILPKKNVSILLFSHRPQISLKHNQSTQHKCCRSIIGNAFEFDYQISASAIKLICHCVYARRHSKYSVAAAMTAAATTIHQQMRRKRMNERPNERTHINVIDTRYTAINKAMGTWSRLRVVPLLFAHFSLSIAFTFLLSLEIHIR